MESKDINESIDKARRQLRKDYQEISKGYIEGLFKITEKLDKYLESLRIKDWGILDK